MNQLIALVGNTPIIEIPHFRSNLVKVFAKLEWCNPSGSVKDRAAAAILTDAISRNLLVGKTLIDATSGNTGIAYAMMGAALGIPVELALPDNASEERKLILRSYGATLHLTSPLEGTDGAQRVVADIVRRDPEKYYYPDQYNNPSNWQAHFKGTGPEIWKQTNKKVTHFVAGLGTTGTFVGTSRYLQSKGVECIAVQPDNPMHGLEGWKHLETAIVPGIYDATIAEDVMEIDTDSAFLFARAAAEYLGLFLSPSSAANLVAALRLSEFIDDGVIVTIFPDNGMKYLRESFWRDDVYHIDENPFV